MCLTTGIEPANLLNREGHFQAERTLPLSYEKLSPQSLTAKYAWLESGFLNKKENTDLFFFL